MITSKLASKSINHHISSSYHRQVRERLQHSGRSQYQKKRQRQQLARKIRKDVYHKKYYTRLRQKATDTVIQTKKKSFVLNFIGNALSTGYGIKGHSRCSIKPMIKRMLTDDAMIVDEFLTTKLCTGCTPQAFQMHRRNGKCIRIKGTVVCVNPLCPKRKSKQTTTNHDGGASVNIATNGLHVALTGESFPSLKEV